MSNIKRRSFLVGAAALPIAVAAAPTTALAGFGDVVRTGSNWDDDLFYVKMSHRSFVAMANLRKRFYPVVEEDESFNPNVVPSNIVYLGKDGENTYCIMRNRKPGIFANGQRHPYLPTIGMRWSHIIVGMNDGKVYKDRHGDFEPRKFLPFPNMERV
jgi:hypothetical protein